MSAASRPSLRERTWQAVRAEIAASALPLFLESGFDAVTVEQIAAAAGISRRSFFRYFDTKEDVLIGDAIAQGEVLRHALQARPLEESAWDALRAAFYALRAPETSREAEMALTRMCNDTPSLHARHVEKQLRWQELLAPELAKRIDHVPEGARHLHARAIIATALVCLDLAFQAWLDAGGAGDVRDFYDQTVAAVRT